MNVETTDVRTGTDAAEGITSSTVGTFARKNVSATALTDSYSRIGFKVKSATGTVTLLRLRTATSGSTQGTSIGVLSLNSSGFLAFTPNGLTAITSTVVPSAGWHSVETHLTTAGTGTSTLEVWLDGVAVPGLSTSTTSLGTAGVGQIEIGSAAAGGTWDVLFDDVGFATSRMGV